jgi:hypothetical protein
MIGIGLLGVVLRDLTGASRAVVLAAHHQAIRLHWAVMLASTLLAALLPGRPASRSVGCRPAGAGAARLEATP